MMINKQLELDMFTVKDDRVEELPEGWRWVRLGDAGKYINGRAFKPEEWGTKGLPIIRIQNLTDANAPFNYYSKPVERKYYVKSGDLLVSWSATLDSFIWDGQDAILNQHIFRAEVNKRLVHKEFLYYVIKHILIRMKEETHGSTMKHITKRKFEDLGIPLPPLEEQKHMVARINAILPRLEQAKKLREAALKDTKAIMQSALHEILLKAEEKGWNRGCLDEVVDSARYGISKKANVDGKGYPIIRMINIKDGSIDYSDLKFVELDEKEAAKYSLKYGDILINRTNSFELVGKSGVFEKTETYVFASYLIRLRINEKRADPKFINLLINSEIGRDYISRTCRRAIAQANINAKEIKAMPIILPRLSEQKSIVAYLDKLQERVESLRQMQAKTKEELEAIIPTVLDRAFRGKL